MMSVEQGSKMVINFLTGDLVFNGQRTGVHTFYHKLITELTKDAEVSPKIKVSCYASSRQIKSAFPKYSDEPYGNSARFSFRLARILSYFLPIELFFGKSDVYVCDGLIPRTLFASKKIAVVHDMMVFLFPQNYSLLSRLYLRVWLRQCRHADCILTVSESTKNDIAKYLNYPKSGIHVVGCGVDAPAPPIADPRTSDYIDAVGYFVYVGDMRPNKNLLRMVKAFEKYLPSHPDDVFYIAGNKTWEYESINRYVLSKGLENHVRFLGFVSEEEKWQLYAHARALVFASLYEGFGIPILEAASCDCPVITSNTSSMVEIASDCCVIVDPESVDSIAEGLEKVVDSETRKKVIQLQRHLLSRYTWKSVYRSARPFLVLEK